MLFSISPGAGIHVRRFGTVRWPGILVRIGRSWGQIFALKQTILTGAFRGFTQSRQANYVTDASFYILSKSLFTNHSRYIPCDPESDVE